MPALLQICIVIVTISVLAVALLTFRRIARFFDRAAEDLAQLTLSVRESVDEVHLVASESRAFVASLRECVPPVQRVVDRLEAVGQRTADLSSTLLDELELPVFTAAAVVCGVRSGAGHFLRRMMLRFTHRSSQFNGGPNHE